ncbi:ABC transporter permease [Egicoccus sp. AB-alg2]|uniref:ABC transporter permease n=1 Tax=Egicoccus sp. AB-alg2 TaxID=3242693 RepID=UPI00359E5B48
MTPLGTAVTAGTERAWIEFRRGFTNATDLGFYVVMSVVVFAILWFNRDTVVQVPGYELPSATYALPSFVGGLIAFLSVLGVAYALAMEREDGTLLRAKSLPHGMTGYVVGQVLRTTLETIAGLTLALVPAMLFIDGILVDGVGGLVWLPAILVLGLLATLPIGVVIGAVVRSVRQVNTWGSLPLFALIWASGIFVPTIALPQWARVVGQLFPVYWLGLGTRAVLLPDEAAALEIGGSWRPGWTVAVLVAWAVAGVLVAVPILKRMAARESGSAIAERRERALQRTY